MTEEQVTFQTFIDPETAKDFAEKLNEAGIECVIEDDAKFFDVSFARDTLQNQTRLKLKASDFEKAHEILGDYYKANLDNIDKSYYLFEFSDFELTEVIRKPDQWGILDYQLAKKILGERGKPVSIITEEQLKEERLKELSKTKTVEGVWIVAAYLLIIFSWYFGLLLCFGATFFGWFIHTNKRVLPNGKKINLFSAQTRMHGKAILFSGIACLIIYTIVSIMFSYRASFIEFHF